MYDDYFEEDDNYEDDYYPEDIYWETEETLDDDYANPSPLFLFPPIVILIVGVFLVVFLSGLKTSARAGGELASSQTEPYASHPGLSPLFTPEIHFWGEKIMEWASETGLDPNLIATVMQIESCGDSRATSSAGRWDSFRSCPIILKVVKTPTTQT